MRTILVALSLGLACAAAQPADEPAPSSFAWRGTLDTGGQSGLVRAALPAEALVRLQSRDAADLRVFDSGGEPVAFAFARPPRPPAEARQQTAGFRALPLYAAPPGTQAPKGTVQFRVDERGERGERRSLWVQLGPEGARAVPRGAQPLQAALFDTRAQKDSVTALVLRARIPANTPVRFTFSTSPDLASWTPVAVQGRIFRFDGEGAPANDRLELNAPLALQDRYLRAEWRGQEGVAVDALVGLLAAHEPEPVYPAVTLPAPVADGATALEWQLGFATPIARLELGTARENTIVPLRLLGRNQPSEPWRLLGSTLVYRLGAPGQESTNVPAVLAHPSVRWLRVEATHGARLAGIPLAARVLFEPLEVVFPAGSAAPYQIAAGRPATPAAALPLGMLAATTTTRIDALPLVKLSSMQGAAEAAAGSRQRWLPRGVDGKTAGLWLVLAVGVLLLGGVAWTLMRQLNAKPPGG
jgi:hypothetical protein